VVTVVHNAVGHEPRPGERALARWALGGSDALVTLSASVTADVRALGLRVPLVETVHPTYDFGAAVGRDEARRVLGLEPKAPVLLFFGFVRRYKGLHVLLDAMPHVLAERPDARLVVAGEFYADEAALRSQAAPLGDAVRFDAHYVPDGAVAPYFGAADVVVQPYVSATQSGVAQIAHHFGRPLVTTDVGGLAASVQAHGSGLVVPPEDPRALASAILDALDPSTYERLRACASEARADSSWANLAAVLESCAYAPLHS
jgi:glycosyltransferase involved in cell wall biosynthesis